MVQKKHSFGFVCPKLPEGLSEDELMEWFLERFGNSIGLETAYYAFQVTKDHQNEIDHKSFINISIEKRP